MYRLIIALLLFSAAQIALAQERLLYTTDISDWGTYPSLSTPDSLTVTTHYSEEPLTFTFQQVLIRQDGCSSSFYEGRVHPLAMTERKSTPFLITSPLRSVTRLRMVQGATGGNCGFRLEARGDGDADWVALIDQRINSGWHEDWVDVNRTNVQLRLSNLSSSQNAYLFELDIYGNINPSMHPWLDSFQLHGVTYDPGLTARRNAQGELEATFALHKDADFSAPLKQIQTLGGAKVSRVNYQVIDPLHTVATVTLQRKRERQIYRLHFVGKPDHEITYIDHHGRTIGRQLVEQDAAIQTFAYDSTSLVLQPGERFRGWCDDAIDGDRIPASYVITKPLTLHALVTGIEQPATQGRLFYELRNPHFDPNEHEGFLPSADCHYADRRHGWFFPAGSSLKVLTGPESYVVLGSCAQLNNLAWQYQQKQGSGQQQAVVIGHDTLWMAPRQEGERHLYHYQGPAGALTLHFPADTYLHSIAIDNVASDPIIPDETGYYMVRPGDADHLLTTLDVVNHRSSQPNAEPAFIFIPDGDYDLGVTSLTPLMGHRVSLIGQSMQGTVIHNLPWIEGIGTATLLNLGTGNYLQDLTLQNDLDYYADTEAGRAPCLQDNGDLTICKRVRMLSYQDTYYSNRNGQRLYWEDSELHGCFDYLCGRGTVFYNRVNLVLESMERHRQAGEAIITAPYTAEGDMGYIFDHCTVEIHSATFNWGRAWGGRSHLAFLYTRIPDGSMVRDTRFDPEGMNAAATDFFEYGTTDSLGRLVTPQSNIVHFTHQSGDQTYETVLPTEKVKSYSLRSIFPNWQPDVDCAQLEVSNLTLVGKTLKWKSPVPHAAAMILIDGHEVAITRSDTYQLEESAIAGHCISIRLANARGGFGNPVFIP